MRNRLLTLLFCLTISARALGTAFGDGLPSSASPTPQQARKAVERGLTFLEADAVKWRKEHGCASCHQGVLTVWALTEAKAQGYPVNEAALADFTAWARGGNVPALDQQRDPRPGWRLVSQRAVYLAMASYNLPILSRDEVRRVAVHLQRHQEADGAYELPPHANAPPPVFFESREVASLFALLAWEPYVSTDARETATNRAAREKTVAWLKANPTSGTTQAAALRLLLAARTGRPLAELQEQIAALWARQNADGGWGQEREMGSDAYATGQVLYALSFSGVKPEQSEVQRAIGFLVRTQREDGSWLVPTRNYPDANWKRTGLAMNYFGSAWAELGLARYVPH